MWGETPSLVQLIIFIQKYFEEQILVWAPCETVVFGNYSLLFCVKKKYSIHQRIVSRSNRFHIRNECSNQTKEQ